MRKLTRRTVLKGAAATAALSAVAPAALAEDVKTRKIVRLAILDPEDAMRIADIDDTRTVQKRRICWADMKLDHACVGKGLGQRNIFP